MRGVTVLLSTVVFLLSVACGEGSGDYSPAKNAACDLYAKCGGSKAECLENADTPCDSVCEASMMTMVECMEGLPCDAEEEEAMALCGTEHTTYKEDCQACFDAQNQRDSERSTAIPPRTPEG